LTNVTTLSGELLIFDEYSYHVVHVGYVDGTAVLDGFTITKGRAMGTSVNYGGGMDIAGGSPTLINLTFTGNEAVYGGGMYIQGGSPTLTNLTFTGNEAAYGGGIYITGGSPTLTNLTFTGNVASSGGGGIYNENSSGSLNNVSFSDNSARDGRGMYNRNGSNPTLTNVTYSGNTATGYEYMLDSGGGGMLNYESSPTLSNVTFSGNSTTYALGGGMLNYKSSPTLTNVTFSGNTTPYYGGGIYNTLSQPIMINSIMWGDEPDEINNESSIPIVNYSVIQGGYTGTGIIVTDPRLGLLADNGGFTQTHALGAGSSAIDIGNPGFCPPTDQRGVARPVDGNGDGDPICDMGAYEYVPYYSYLPLIVK